MPLPKALPGLIRFRLPNGVKTSEDITISYTLSGTALNGTDYNTLSSSVVMPAGMDYVDFFVNTIDDKIIEGTEEYYRNADGRHLRPRWAILHRAPRRAAQPCLLMIMTTQSLTGH